MVETLHHLAWNYMYIRTSMKYLMIGIDQQPGCLNELSTDAEWINVSVSWANSIVKQQREVHVG